MPFAALVQAVGVYRAVARQRGGHLGFFPPRLEERFDGAARAEHPLHVLRLDQVVHLVEVEVIGLQELERLLQLLPRAIFVALLGLAGQEVLLEIPPGSWL